jgi:predicted ATPase
MSGKSNILDVFAFVRQICFPQSGANGVSYALAQRGGVNEVLWKGGDEKLITIGIDAADESDATEKFRYSLELVAGTGGFVSIQHESLKLVRDKKEIDLVVLEQGFVHLKNIDGKVVGNFGTLDSFLQHAQPNWDGYKFRQLIERFRFYHLFPPEMKESSPMVSGEVLTPAGENFSAWLMWLQTKSPESFSRLNEVLRDLFPDVAQIKSNPTADGNVHLQVLENGLKRPVTVWQVSDGFLVLTALLSLIYAPPDLNATLLCLEEPENYLHPRLLETVVALLRQVRQEAQDSKGSSFELIVSTQSPYLVNQFSIEEIIWVEKKKGETRAYRPANKRHLRKLVEDEDFGLGDLMFTGALGQD